VPKPVASLRSASWHNIVAEDSPHVTIKIAEMATRHAQAALPRSRGGRLSLLFIPASPCAVSRAGSTDVSTFKAFSTCNNPATGAMFRHDGESRHHLFRDSYSKDVRYLCCLQFYLTECSGYKVMELVPCEVHRISDNRIGLPDIGETPRCRTPRFLSELCLCQWIAPSDCILHLVTGLGIRRKRLREH